MRSDSDNLIIPKEANLCLYVPTGKLLFGACVDPANFLACGNKL